ncbi:MAG TPA: hypothetical protein VI796_05960 [Candidatus Thermoplasmatota archaeon]|nr:hypothetical protein [Candidatus Thermoplasmatota archaeon]
MVVTRHVEFANEEGESKSGSPEGNAGPHCGDYAGYNDSSAWAYSGSTEVTPWFVIFEPPETDDGREVSSLGYGNWGEIGKDSVAIEPTYYDASLSMLANITMEDGTAG